MKIHLKTYGCTYNQADSDAMTEILRSKGHDLTPEEDAEVVVVNTCAVKDATEQKELFYISHATKPLVVTGCLAQVIPELVEKLNPFASLVGTFAQANVAEAVEAAAVKQRVKFLEKSAPLQNAFFVQGKIGRIKISRGCLSACSFCQTKLARGCLESLSVGELRRLARELLRQGALEIQLTSQDCGCYGFDIGANAADLLTALNSIEGSFRIRLGMGNPEHFKRFFPELLEAMASDKVYKFLHIPVQSGSDTVLAHMKRPYSTKDFEDIVRQFRQKFTDGTLETDIIVGYPAETEDDFKQTLHLLEKTRPDIVNVSKYSSRPKTPAAKLPQLPNHEVKRRSEVCSVLCRKLALESNARLVGKRVRVFAVEKTPSGQVLCRSVFYKPVLLEDAVFGKQYEVCVEAAGQSHLKGAVTNS